MANEKYNNHVEVIVTIEALEITTEGTERVSQYLCTYEVGYENDQLKILKGEFKKI